jgi:hypothetical protein
MAKKPSINLRRQKTDNISEEVNEGEDDDEEQR